MTEDMLGRVLDKKYRLTAVLGEGGMGAVYEAEHVLLHHKVAVKVLHPEFSEKPEAVKRFIREAQAASAIGHPNILNALDYGEEEDGTIFIVMELLKGESLLELLGRDRLLPQARAVSIILQVLSALHAAHAKGIVHRDLKPDNVFIAEDARGNEEVKLFDFGVAKFLKISPEDSLGLTKTGTVLGTPYYLAPEQARGGKDIDERIDIWSVGVMLYEMLSGELPFEGDNYNEILGLILLDEPRPLAELAPELDDGVVAVVEKALVKDRDGRWRSVGTMIKALIPYHEGDVDVMTASAASALKNSLPPPTGVQPIPDVRAESPTRDKTGRQFGGTLASGVYEVADEEPSRGWKNAFRIAGAAAVLGALVVVLFLVLSRGDPPESTPPKPEEAPRPSAAAITPPSSPADAQDAAPEASPPAKELPGEITVTVEGMPDGAKVEINGNEQELPIRVPRSDEPVIIKVTAAGFEEHAEALVPDTDRVVRVELKKEPKKRVKRGKRRKEKKRKADNAWADNPFDK